MAESDDAQLELKKRARRRLVGATALALLAAIVLPMVMEHEPRPPAQDIQVRIPSQDAGSFTSRILPTKPAPTPLPPVAETKPATEAAPEPKPAPKPDTPEPKPVVKVDVRPPATKAEPPPPSAPAAMAEQKSETSRASNALAGGTTEQWVVQLGAYKEAGNVKLRVAKLKEVGVPTYTEKIDTPQGQRTRVRAGPFPSKEAAEKARVKIKIVGIDGPVAPK